MISGNPSRASMRGNPRLTSPTVAARPPRRSRQCEHERTKDGKSESNDRERPCHERKPKMRAPMTGAPNILTEGRCPECGSQDVAVIVYGYTSGEPRSENFVDGGCRCFRDERDPRWACCSCGHRWGGVVPSAAAEALFALLFEAWEQEDDEVAQLAIRRLATLLPASTAGGTDSMG